MVETWREHGGNIDMDHDDDGTKLGNILTYGNT
jgi:hypothetical protein